MESIEYYQNIARENIKANKSRNTVYEEIDRMVEAEFDVPASLKNLAWIKERKFVSLAPRNATMAAIRAFATLMPSIDIEPTNNIEEEYQRVERMETALEWHYKLLNMGREQSAHWKVIESAVKYCNVALQVNYHPFEMKKRKGKRAKLIKQRGDFSFTVHHPSTVHPRYSEDGLESVTLAQTRTVQSIVDLWGKENEGVKQLLADTESDTNEKGADRLNTEVSYYDYTDIEHRVVWCTFNEADLPNATGVSNDAYIFCMKKHKMPFINWAIKDNREPVLKGVYSTWETANIIKTIIYAKHIETAGKPQYWTKVLSPDDEVDINYNEIGSPLKLLQGQEVGVLPPAPIDQQLAKTEADLDSQIYQSTAASILNSVERMVGSNISFSSMNAALQAAMGQLGLAKMTAEQVLQEAFLLVFRWIDYSGEPLEAYRDKTKSIDGVEFSRGTKIALMPGDAPEDVTEPNLIYFDPDHLYINVKLNANTISDEQGRITNEINKVERLGFSQQSAYEKIGGMDFEREQGQKIAEALTQHELNMKIRRDQMMLQLEIEQQKMQMRMQQQMQMQQAQQQTTQASNRQMNQAGAFAGAQGIDTRGGGQAAQASAPQMTREAINQADANGVPLA